MTLDDIKELYKKLQQMPIPNFKHTTMIQNTIDELIKINDDLVQNDKIDADTYHSILTRLESIKKDAEWKLNVVSSVMSESRIDIISSPYIEKGVAKMIVNIDDLHRIMAHEFDKKQQ